MSIVWFVNHKPDNSRIPKECDSHCEACKKEAEELAEVLKEDYGVI